MLGQIPRTEFDLEFSLLGIPVRVHPVFWLTSVWLSWNQATPPEGGVEVDTLLLCVLAIFVAILVHEMGHALVTRSYGWQPEIVLYFLGGYATTTRHSTWKDIAVSAAGPGAGFLLWISIWWWARAFDIVTPASTILRPVFIVDGTHQTELIATVVHFSLFINFVWNAMNLVPVLPLDGGQISRELCLWFDPRRGMQRCLLISALAAGGVALYAFNQMMARSSVFGLDPLFLGVMFGFLAFQSYQGYESQRRGYW